MIAGGGEDGDRHPAVQLWPGQPPYCLLFFTSRIHRSVLSIGDWHLLPSAARPVPPLAFSRVSKIGSRKSKMAAGREMGAPAAPVPLLSAVLSNTHWSRRLQHWRLALRTCPRSTL